MENCGSQVCQALLPVGVVDIVLTLNRPIMALVGGLEAPPGRIMGHAGARVAPGEPDAQTKYQALERAGAVMVNHPEKFGEGMKTLLGNRATRSGTSVSFKSYQFDLASLILRSLPLVQARRSVGYTQ
jgi:hypothetical protein